MWLSVRMQTVGCVGMCKSSVYLWTEGRRWSYTHNQPRRRDGCSSLNRDTSAEDGSPSSAADSWRNSQDPIQYIECIGSRGSWMAPRCRAAAAAPQAGLGPNQEWYLVQRSRLRSRFFGRLFLLFLETGAGALGACCCGLAVDTTDQKPEREGGARKLIGGKFDVLQ